MPHAPTRSLEQRAGVVEKCAREEANVNVRLEYIHIAKCGTSHAGRGAAIMQKLVNIAAATSEYREPLPSKLI